MQNEQSLLMFIVQSVSKFSDGNFAVANGGFSPF